MDRKRGPNQGVSRNRGFTLLEVVIAMLLLGIGLLALFALQIRSVQSNAFSNCMTMASGFAQDQVERLRASNWEDISNGSDTIRDITGATPGVFVRQWAIQTNGRMKDVSVRVSWNQDGRSHQVAVNTRIAKRQ